MMQGTSRHQQVTIITNLSISLLSFISSTTIQLFTLENVGIQPFVLKRNAYSLLTATQNVLDRFFLHAVSIFQFSISNYHLPFLSSIYSLDSGIVPSYIPPRLPFRNHPYCSAAVHIYLKNTHPRRPHPYLILLQSDKSHSPRVTNISQELCTALHILDKLRATLVFVAYKFIYSSGH